MKMRDDVFDFIEAVGRVDGETHHDIVGIYERLVDEEYKEFVFSGTDDNKLQEAMDLVWVILGYCITREWDIQGAWNELTRSNMSKLQVDPTTGRLKRRADGKIMKPDGWKGPNFKPFINNKEVSDE